MGGNKNQNGAGQNEVSDALAILAKAVLGEDLQSIRDSMKSLESTMSEQIRKTAENGNSSIQSLKNELLARIDDVASKVQSERKERSDAIGKLNGDLSASIGDLTKKTKEYSDRSQNELRDMRKSSQEDFLRLQEKIHADTKSMSKSVSQHQEEIDSLWEENKRISALLDNLGRIFAAPQSGPASATGDMKEKLASKRPAASTASGRLDLSQGKKAAAATRPKGPLDDNLPAGDDVEKNIDGLFMLGK